MAVAPPVLRPDEPVPVRLMNTIWADRSGVHDALTTPDQLRAWLAAVGLDAGQPDAGDLDRFRALRDALRGLAAVVTADSRSRAESAIADADRAVGVLNRAVREAPALPALAYRQGRLHRILADRADPSRRALSVVARHAVDLLSGPDGVRLRACYASRCVRYFVKDHPRRQWCSTSCSNRVRAARHYQRHHSGGGAE